MLDFTPRNDADIFTLPVRAKGGSRLTVTAEALIGLTS